MLERTSARFLNERPRVRIPPGLQSGPKQLGYLETNPDAFTRPPFFARVSQPAEDAGSDPVCCRCKSCPWHERHEPNVFGYQYEWGGRGFESRRAKARSSVGERQRRARSHVRDASSGRPPERSTALHTARRGFDSRPLHEHPGVLRRRRTGSEPVARRFESVPRVHVESDEH